MQADHGVFTVSLDFELYWGVRDSRRLADYAANLQGVQQAVPQILQLFAKNGIHATWATVGFLFCRDRAELLAHRPEPLPGYSNPGLCPWHYVENAAELDPAAHFAPELIEQIRAEDGQEIATHTLSHYYCLEPGQTLAAFEADMGAALGLATRHGVPVTSLVFPRNQWNSAYLESIANLGLQCFRGTESSWMYRASDAEGQGTLRRLLRLLDSYVNVTGANSHDLAECTARRPFNFPASRFLRPFSKRLAPLEGLRLRRIENAMTEAAVNGRLFHLWWHPHNFGVNTAENMEFLSKVLAHYQQLRRSHGMQSLNMAELSKRGQVALAS